VRARDRRPGAAARDLLARGLLARHRTSAHQARSLPPLPRPSRPRAHARAAARPGPPLRHRGARRRVRRRGHGRRSRRRPGHRVHRHPTLEPRGGPLVMSKEILEATTALAREKGIAPDKLFFALEDALLSAYKKTPGAAK